MELARLVLEVSRIVLLVGFVAYVVVRLLTWDGAKKKDR